MEEEFDSDLLRAWTLTSSLNFTRYFFKQNNDMKFIIGKHHKLICDALDDVLNGKCNKLIINISPRYGKCIDPATQVLTKRGLVRADEVAVGDHVGSFREGHFEWHKCLGTGKAHKSSVKIRMRSGREFICSEDHPMLTTFGYIEASKLKSGDRIQALRTKYEGTHEIDDAELDFVSLMIFEGCCGKHLHFSSGDDNIVVLMQETCEKLGFKLSHRPSDNYCDFGFIGSAKARSVLRKYGVDGHLAYDKRIPRDWFTLSIRQRLRFLDLMFATDGYASKHGQSGITLANRELVLDIQALLASIGIISSISDKKTKCHDAWRLSIPRRETVKLLSLISFMQKREMAEQALSKKAVCITDTLPYEIIRKERMTYKTMKPPYRCVPSKEITREKFKRLAKAFPQLEKYLCDDFYLDKVILVESVGDKDLIDLEVEGTHNFIANGLVSHNTECAVKNFIAMGLAVNPSAKFIHLSYSANLAQDNSIAVKNIVQSEAYQRLYPTRISYGKNMKSQWETDQGGGLYATSTLGQITGFGAGLVEREDEVYRFGGAIVIDDPIKPEDALSDVIRERVNRRFETTIRNRVNSRNTPIIIIMQRLHEHDLCGYLQEIEKDEWRVLSLPVIQINEKGEREALWPYKHTLEELDKINAANSFVFETQYMQNPTPMEGLMYEHPFKTYSTLPPVKLGTMCNCTDSADTGADYLCSITYLAMKDGYYVTDVIFTKKSMEHTEPWMAQMLAKWEVRYSVIESNNGGRAFARNVERLSREYGNHKTTFITFTQTKNKAVRIFTRSQEVNNMLIFPEGWERKWPEFANMMKSYRKEGNNAHDDACFAAGTLVATLWGNKPIEKLKVGDYVLTPFGAKRILACGKTGHKPTVLRFGLQVTENHKFFSLNSFKPVMECDENSLSLYGFKEQLLWRFRRLLLSTESNTVLWGREGIILASRRVTKDEKVQKVFMLQFGNFITNKKFLKATAFIIKTIILLITTSVTWSVYRLSNTCRNTGKKIGKIRNIGQKVLKYLMKYGNPQLNGIKVKKDENGTLKTARTESSSLRRLFVNIVEKLSNPHILTLCSAATNAVTTTEENTSSTTQGFARNAEKSLNTEKEFQLNPIENSAAARATSQTTTGNARDVYNITVDAVGCYYANGILVSNCDCATMIIERGSLICGASDSEILSDFL